MFLLFRVKHLFLFGFHPSKIEGFVILYYMEKYGIITIHLRFHHKYLRSWGIWLKENHSPHRTESKCLASKAFVIFHFPFISSEGNSYLSFPLICIITLWYIFLVLKQNDMSDNFIISFKSNVLIPNASIKNALQSPTMLRKYPKPKTLILKSIFIQFELFYIVYIRL